MTVAPAVRRLAARLGIAAATVALISSIAFVAASRTVSDVTARIERIDVVVDEPPLPEPEAGNYLIVGSDSRAFAIGDPGSEEAFGTVDGARSDTMMVAHVDPAAGEVIIVSFPRDLLVDIPGHGPAKLNAALDSGPDVLLETFRVNFDLEIHHYVNVDFASFQGLVDAMGGVQVNVVYPMRDWHYDPERREWVNETGLDLGPGCQVLSGEQALAYVRTRYYQEERDGRWQSDPTADLGRITRQQQFVRVLASAARERALANPLDAKRLADAAVSHLTADRELQQAEILGALNSFRHLDPANPDSLYMARLPVVDGGSVRNVGAVVVPEQPAADELLARLRVFAPPEVETTTTPAPDPGATAPTSGPEPTEPPPPPPPTAPPVSGTPLERC